MTGQEHITDAAVEAYRAVPRPGCPNCGRVEVCRCYVDPAARQAQLDAYDRARLAAAYPHLASRALREAADLPVSWPGFVDRHQLAANEYGADRLREAIRRRADELERATTDATARAPRAMMTSRYLRPIGRETLELEDLEPPGDST
jgi:hypothetical protein